MFCHKHDAAWSHRQPDFPFFYSYCIRRPHVDWRRTFKGWVVTDFYHTLQGMDPSTSTSGPRINKQMCGARYHSWWKVVAWSFFAVASGHSYRGVASEDSRYARDVLSCDGGKNVMNVDRMNDDYCDCKDGLDEPGTSSCASVVTSDTTFWCLNSGHVSKRISLSRVDDGICESRASQRNVLGELSEHRRLLRRCR